MSRSAIVRRRLDAAETLHTVVSTMKTLASVRIGQYRHAVAALDDANRTIELALQTLLRLYPELLEAEGERPGARLAAVVFGSDRGLCGAFNERVARHAHGLLSARVPPGGEATLVAVGRRMRSRMEALGWPVEGGVDPPGSLAAVEGATLELLQHVDAWRETARAERLFLVHARPASGAGYEPYALQLLPLDPSWLQALHDRTWPSRRLPVAFGDGDALLRGLLRQLVAHALVRAFAASQASENAARLMAMEAAERNVEDRLHELRNAYQAARQSAITAELLDIQVAYLAAGGDAPDARSGGHVAHPLA
jgi:F-type H+-transporting ATPase subunit gamma